MSDDFVKKSEFVEFKELVHPLLKDLRDYFAMQDAVQERAKVDKTPKIAETQKNISGGKAPAGFAPASGVAKQLVPASTEGTSEAEISGNITEPGESTQLKALNVEEEEVEDIVPEEEKGDEIPTGLEDETLPEEEETSEKEEMMEMKSLLKDIRKSLAENAGLKKEITELKKSVDGKIKKGIEQGMQRLGFTTTKPAITRLGLDEIVKSADNEAKPEAVGADKIDEITTQMARKFSWSQLGTMREQAGDLNPFPMYRPSQGAGK